MKIGFGIVITALTLQGCAAAPLVGAAAGAGVVASANKSGEETAVWSAKVDRMNCSQKRAELVRLEKKNNFLSALNPADHTGIQISTLKSTMITQGCRLPA